MKLSDLLNLTPEGRKQKIEELMQSAIDPTPEQLKNQLDSIKKELTDLEEKYQVVSTEMMYLLETGKLEETQEICHWAITWRRYQNFVSRIHYNAVVASIFDDPE